MNAQAQSNHGIRHFLHGVAQRWREHRDAARSLREIEALDPALASGIAQEAGLTVADLKEVVAQGSGAERLMERMMAAYCLGPLDLEREAPGLLRDVAILCSRCQSKGRCAQELEAGTARENARLFCPNADTFETFGL